MVKVYFQKYDKESFQDTNGSLDISFVSFLEFKDSRGKKNQIRQKYRID